jgi:hypothetical protein
MTPDQLRQVMLDNIAEMKAHRLIVQQMTPLQRAIMDANQAVLTKYDRSIDPYLILVCANLAPEFKEYTVANLTAAQTSSLQATCTAKAINWQFIQDLLTKAGDFAQVLAAILQAILGKLPTPTPALKSMASQCPTPDPNDSRDCCTKAEHHLACAMCCLTSGTCDPSVDCCPCCKDAFCHVLKALECLSCQC